MIFDFADLVGEPGEDNTFFKVHEVKDQKAVAWLISDPVLAKAYRDGLVKAEYLERLPKTACVKMQPGHEVS